MSILDYDPTCAVTQYLLEKSKLLDNDREAQMASALLYELGYPEFILKIPDISLNPQVFRLIAEIGETKLLSEAAGKCAHCTQSGGCKIEAQFNAGY